MQDFESKEGRSYQNLSTLNMDEMDSTIDLNKIVMADIEVNDNIMLAVHRS